MPIKKPITNIVYQDAGATNSNPQNKKIDIPTTKRVQHREIWDSSIQAAILKGLIDLVCKFYNKAK